MNSLKEKIVNDSRWYPQSVQYYKKSIRIEGNYSEVGQLKSNFAYNMQYIEYLQKQIEEFNLSNVILKMCYKTYIIYSMSVIEMLFSYMIRKTNNWPQDTWEKKETFKANPKRIDKEKVLIETIIYSKTEKFDRRMDFDSMIKKVESKNLININHESFPLLKHLRMLRNKIHIQQGLHSTDHDFNNFDEEDFWKAKKILCMVLFSDELCNNQDTFSFLIEEESKN